jgi:iron complex transport system substrate-binding protein
VKPEAALLGLILLASAPAGPAAVQSLGPAPPETVRRVVTLAPSLTDTVLALGAGDVLVGVSRFDERPEVQKLPRVGGFVDPSVESVAALHPDLLLVQPGPGNRHPVEVLAGLGIPVLALRLGSVDDVLSALRAVGAALGKSARGDELARELERTRREVRARAGVLGKVRVLFVYGFEPLVVAGPGSFADELLRDAGGVNVAVDAERAYPVWSVERALEARAELVLDAAMLPAGRETLKALPGLRSARWVELSSPALLHPGPALGQGLEELFRVLHPGQALREAARWTWCSPAGLPRRRCASPRLGQPCSSPRSPP